MFRYESRHFNERRGRGGDRSWAKESVVASTQFRAIGVSTGPEVHHRCPDGRELNCLCCNVFRVIDGLDCRISMDANPVIVGGGGPVGVGETAGRSMRFWRVSV